MEETLKKKLYALNNPTPRRKRERRPGCRKNKRKASEIKRIANNHEILNNLKIN